MTAHPELSESGLRGAFEDGFGALMGDGDMNEFFDFVADDALFIGEDSPLILDRDGLRDHIGFHQSGIWERVYFTFRDMSYDVYGQVGAISGNFQLRGKPTDAGYRQRDGMVSVTCYFDERSGKWNVIRCHFSSLLSAIYHSSPG